MKVPRSLFGALAASLALTATAADFHDHIGLQLWSLRDQTKASTTGALDVAANFGFTEVETAGTGSLSFAEFGKELQARKLTVVAVHIGYEILQKDINQAIANTKILGAKYLICPALPHAKPFTADDARRVAAEFNTWGQACADAGIKFGYHTHGFEFVPATVGGETPFDVLMHETKPGLVSYEMDVFWVFHAGVDPVKLLEKYPGRWVFLHVKDMRKGAPRGFATGSAAPTDKVAVGNGQIDWPAVIGTAEKLGVTHYFIEDEGVQPLKDIPASLKYLKALKL
jgi:sugar phosphate isomerase/epimerase